MNNPKDEQRDHHGLELEPETLADLDAEEKDAEQIRGGGCGGGPSGLATECPGRA